LKFENDHNIIPPPPFLSSFFLSVAILGSMHLALIFYQNLIIAKETVSFMKINDETTLNERTFMCLNFFFFFHNVCNENTSQMK
jgi:hypothetical protein